MVRTKDGGGAARTVASKAPRKALGGGGASETVTVPRRLQAGKSPLLRSSLLKGYQCSSTEGG